MLGAPAHVSGSGSSFCAVPNAAIIMGAVALRCLHPPGANMDKLDLASFLTALADLPEAFEKYPHGAMWVGGLTALAIICQTVVRLTK